MADAEERRGISRRTLLVGGGAGIGLAIAWGLWPRSYAPNLRTAEGETLFNAFLKIATDGRVIVVVPQAEIGQGVYTTLPQALADELGADWRTVAVEPAPLGPLYANQLLAEETAEAGLPSSFHGVGRWVAREYATRNALMITGGSTSIRAFEARMREAGAAARALLSMAAADRWNVNWEELDTREGFVWRGRERIAFGELAEAAAGREPPENLPIRGGSENRLAGQPLPRLDLPSKVDGSALFAGDVRIPEMLFAAVRSGPPGSRLAAIDRAAADRVHGAVAVFENPGWVAAAATNWWAAGRALEALRPRFESRGELASSAGIEAALAAALGGRASRVHEHGEEPAVEGEGAIAALYSVGLAANAPIETLTATARVTGDRMEIWAPTQAPGLARSAAARASGFAESRVTVYQTLVGGGYGRKLEMDAVEQAAILAVKLERPVQLAWPRIQEIQRDSFRPAAAGEMAARLGAGGIGAWRARIAAPASAAQTAARLGADSRFVRPDGSATAGALPPYSIPNLAIEYAEADIGLPTGLWRSGAHSYTCFFTECFVDELARAAGVEPLSFRMQMLGPNPRLARALATAASLGGWDGGPPGSGMGIAAHSAFGSHVATLVEVEIGRDQRVRVLRAVCAVDCGRIINPDVVRQQIEGGLIHGISGAVAPPIEIMAGLPGAATIADLGLPTLADSPEISVELIESDEEPGGVTELAVPTAAPAIANALHSLTGERLRALPLGFGGRR